jgi:uncharacterized protein (DUF2126 family)
VHIEGYPPPYDPRINVIKVTPDPGVIEVNIHPAHSWREAVAITTALYEEARFARLGTEKFNSTASTPEPAAATTSSSARRRRPIARSCAGPICCEHRRLWQNHPALSYLFSGLFIGPTSQAPRVDEARLDSLYELEIAFGKCRRAARRSRPGSSIASSATC